jgi:Gpi18-like mannosyltransferase/predicted membrane-bound dolichyl-phosphate-mannose-protein mannosyltransferase
LPSASRRRFLDPVGTLLVLLLLGFALRIVVAYVLLPQSGLRNDMASFSAWAIRMAELGPGGFYAAGGLVDYPPAYMYVLWLLGEIAKFFEPILGISPIRPMVKLPGMLADLGVATLIYLIGVRFLGDQPPVRWLGSGARIGLIGAAVYLFNPGAVFNSAVWGQMDSVGALVILAGLYALGRGWTEAAGAAAVLAVLIKFQFGWLIPIVAVVGLKRHLFGRSSDPALAARPDPVRVLSSLAVSFGVAIVILLPFGMRLLPTGDPATSIVDKFIAATQTYKGLSINALNWWRNPLTGIWDVQHWGSDQTVLFTVGSVNVTMAVLGVALFATAAVVALVAVARRDDMTGLLLGALLMAVAFFGFPTRVHERYLFPALAIAAPLVGTAVRWAVAYVGLSGLFFLNVYWVYSHDWTSSGPPPLNPGLGGEPFSRDPLLAATVFTQGGVWLLSLFSLALLGWIAWQVARPVRAVDEAGEADAEAAAEAATAAAATRAVREARGRAALRWLRQDPVSEAERAPPRRLDRLDLALFVVIVLVALVFRLWRLDTPRQMIFDEVYHARTAADYLSNWRWGWNRDPYEWTHPMLAKYLIAGGIELADPNQVSGVLEIDVPATALAVAPQRTYRGWPASIVFTSDGSERIEARDVATGELVADWDASGRVASLAFDPDTRRLLVGLRSSGTISTFDLTAFLADEGERAPPPAGSAIETGMAGVRQIVLPLTDQLIVVRGPDEVATFERMTGVELVRREVAADAVSYAAAVGGDTPVTARVVVLDLEANTVQSLDSTTLATETTQALPAPAAGVMMTSGRGTNQLTWVPVGPLAATDEHPRTDAGLTVFRGGDISLDDTVPLPGPASALGWDPVANLVYVAGEGSVWVIEPHGDGRSGFGIYDVVAIDGSPTAVGFDVSDTSQTDDHGELIVATATADGGTLTRIDVSQNAMAWRFAATLFGAFLAGLVYLLTAMLFRRRSIAVLAGVFVAIDLMSYAMSRIAMNDIFVAVFLVAAYALFWPIWSGRWARSAWWVLPLVGVMIGLAAGSKWVGWYALIGLWFLVLLKSQLGRFLVVAATGFATIAIGLEAPWPFFVIMVVSLVLALAISWTRPVRLAPAELWAVPATALVVGAIGLAFVIGFQTLDCGDGLCSEPNGLIELGFGILFRGIDAWWPAALALAISATLLLVRAVRSLRRPESDGRWWAPSEMAGFSWPWIFCCLVVIPVGVYVATYIPWLSLGHNLALEGGIGYGWSLEELHGQMFGYHFGLQAGHAASSPWWSWPLDLKPVWFYSHSFDFERIAVTYNGGNPALFWASVPAVVATLLLAWRRRSWALLLVAAAFAFQFVPWARVERATFQYHYLTAVLFGFIAIAYVLDEILRDRYLRDYGIAFLVAVAITGLLIYPLNSALAMPDWYVNAARTLPPWNYAFQFPDPPAGERPPLISANPVILMAATLVSVWAAAFASFGREWLGPRLAGARESASAATEGGDEDEDADDDEADRPDHPEVQPRDELVDEEPAADEDQDHPEDDVRPRTAPDLG